MAASIIPHDYIRTYITESNVNYRRYSDSDRDCCSCDGFVSRSFRSYKEYMHEIDEDNELIEIKIRNIKQTQQFLQDNPPKLSRFDPVKAYLMNPISILLNIYFILYHWIAWKYNHNVRESTDHGNTLWIGQISLIWFEFCGLIILFIVSIISWSTNHLALCTKIVKMWGSFSSFMFFYEFRPIQVIKTYINTQKNHSKYKQSSIYLIKIISWFITTFTICCLLCIGIISLIIKIYQLSFIQNKDIWDWNMLDMLSLAGFCNQLWNMNNENSLQLDIIYRFILKQYNFQELEDKIVILDSVIRQQFVKSMGVRGFLLALNLNTSMVLSAIIPENQSNDSLNEKQGKKSENTEAHQRIIELEDPIDDEQEDESLDNIEEEEEKFIELKEEKSYEEKQDEKMSVTQPTEHNKQSFKTKLKNTKESITDWLWLRDYNKNNMSAEKYFDGQLQSFILPPITIFQIFNPMFYIEFMETALQRFLSIVVAILPILLLIGNTVMTLIVLIGIIATNSWKENNDIGYVTVFWLIEVIALFIMFILCLSYLFWIYPMGMAYCFNIFFG